ncbi:hypothetical protein [Thiolapillus sp.]|uniref:hypothetical protein n=1 Tax=Thiolapillus sp. TaxID=2017437 RepID=UPI0025DBA251|nr:hypothetical protein [Thiolapillus sp.]
MTRTAGAPIGCQRPSRFWGLGCPKIYHEAEDTLEHQFADPSRQIFDVMPITEAPAESCR